MLNQNLTALSLPSVFLIALSWTGFDT
jgi:hypothetical protein